MCYVGREAGGELLNPTDRAVAAGCETDSKAVGCWSCPHQRRARMGQHFRAKLGPAGRVEPARLQLDEGASDCLSRRLQVGQREHQDPSRGSTSSLKPRHASVH